MVVVVVLVAGGGYRFRAVEDGAPLLSGGEHGHGETFGRGTSGFPTAALKLAEHGGIAVATARLHVHFQSSSLLTALV